MTSVPCFTEVKREVMTKLSSAQTIDINALVALLIIFLTICLLFWLWTMWNLQKQHLQLSTSELFWELMFMYNISTFSHHKYMSSYVTHRYMLEKRFSLLWDFFLNEERNITYQSDLQNLYCKCNCIVLSSFLLNAFNSCWSLGTEHTFRLFTGRAETFKESSTN